MAPSQIVRVSINIRATKRSSSDSKYDYCTKFCIPDLGGWDVVDPLTETSRRWSTYTCAYTNPIRFIDPDGMQIDPANQKEWDRLKGSVTKTSDALQGDVDKINQKAKDKGWILKLWRQKWETSKTG